MSQTLFFGGKTNIHSDNKHTLRYRALSTQYLSPIQPESTDTLVFGDGFNLAVSTPKKKNKKKSSRFSVSMISNALQREVRI